MEQLRGDNLNSCPSPDISAYIDGELALEAELKLELHLSNCNVCTYEMNVQKQLVNALNSSLAADLEIPADFTKRIVTHAESNVSGLRRSSEWPNAALVCGGLFLFLIFALGASARGTFLSFLDIAAQVAVIVGFLSRLLYDLAIGTVVVLRSIGDQPGFSALSLLVATAIVFAALYSSSLIRSGRVKVDHAKSGNSI